MNRRIQILSENRGKVVLNAPVQQFTKSIPGLKMPLAEFQKKLQTLAPEKLEDLIPKETDYISAKFRAISAAYLGEKGYHLDFSRPGVLQQALPLFLDESRGGVRKTVLKVQGAFNAQHTIFFF